MSSGYDCEFVQRPPEIIQTECSICLNVLRKPHLSSCCGHNFCQVCIEDSRTVRGSCPLCNDSKFTIMHNKSLERSLKELKVHCTNRSLGCKWTGSLGQLDTHLNVRFHSQVISGCPYVEVQCVYDCGKSFQRSLVAQHLEKECPKRPMTCWYCRTFKSTFEDITSSHHPVCTHYPVLCPGKCSAYIQRRNIKLHLEEKCPQRLISCEFAYAGCTVKLPQSEMAGHKASEQSTHLTQLATLNKKLSGDVATMKKQFRDLKQIFDEDVLLKDKEFQSLRSEVMGIVRAKDEHIQQLQAALDTATQSSMSEVSKLGSRLHDVHLQSDWLACELGFNSQLLPTTFVVSNFMTRDDAWESRPFYTHPRGYRMSLVVYANGLEKERGRHVSVLVSIKPGEFDTHLSWPFRGAIKILLLNHLQDTCTMHHSRLIVFDESTPNRYACRARHENEDKRFGFYTFLSHNKLTNPPEGLLYIRNGCAYFRVSMHAKLK